MKSSGQDDSLSRVTAYSESSGQDDSLSRVTAYTESSPGRDALLALSDRVWLFVLQGIDKKMKICADPNAVKSKVCMPLITTVTDTQHYRKQESLTHGPTSERAVGW